jgi:hypothetical protein
MMPFQKQDLNSDGMINSIFPWIQKKLLNIMMKHYLPKEQKQPISVQCAGQNSVQ